MMWLLLLLLAGMAHGQVAAPTQAALPAKTMQTGTLVVTIVAAVLAAGLVGTVTYLRLRRRHATPTTSSYARVGPAAHM